MNHALFKTIVSIGICLFGSPAFAENAVDALDANDREIIAKEAPYTMKRIESGDKLSINDIKTMTQLGISDDKIIGTIRTSNSVYNLSSSDIEDLKNHGVSKRVIDTMRQTPY